MSRNLLHVNPFLKKIGSKHCNRGFAAFIASSSICFWYAPTTTRFATLQAQGLAPRAVCNRLKEEGGHTRSRIKENKVWHTQFRVGDVICMRHEYSNCPLLPLRLRNNNNGNYIGPVYVIGVITHGPSQQGCNDLTQELLRRIPALDETTSNELEQNQASYCRVKFSRMGFKKDLEDTTNSYMLSTCQGTIKNICQHGKTWKLDTTPERVRRDLWKNAIISISAEDFDDE